jgi:hypothetical protein
MAIDVLGAEESPADRFNVSLTQCYKFGQVGVLPKSRI